MLRHRPSSTLFPYTTLFRSGRHHQRKGDALPGRRRRPSSSLKFRKSRRPVTLSWVHLPVRNRKRVTLTWANLDRKSTRLNSSHSQISYAVFCLKKKKINHLT